MEVSAKESPFPPASEIPLHKNAPLAPSQELAYRRKCMQLKRRLTEIESNNDSCRKRIAMDKEHVQKLRLLRAILLNHLKEIMETPAKKLSPEQLEKIGMMANGTGREAELASQELAEDVLSRRPENEGLLDDSSEDSDGKEPEPQERPERRKRTNNTNNFRETIMNPETSGIPNPSSYPVIDIPKLAPAANSISPREAPMLTSSFRLATASSPHNNTGVTNQSQYNVQHQQSSQPPYGGDAQFSQRSSPVPVKQAISTNYQSPISNQSRGLSMSHGGNTEPNGLKRTSNSLTPAPIRPRPAFEQFTEHMRPQLEADNYPTDQIVDRIQTEWNNLSSENRSLWDIRYEEQMMEYTSAMDEWKKVQRREGAGGANGNYSTVH